MRCQKPKLQRLRELHQGVVTVPDPGHQTRHLRHAGHQHHEEQAGPELRGGRRPQLRAHVQDPHEGQAGPELRGGSEIECSSLRC